MLANPDLAKAALAQDSANSIPLFDIVNLLELFKVLEIENVAILLLHGEYAVLGRAACILVANAVRDLAVSTDKSAVVVLG